MIKLLAETPLGGLDVTHGGLRLAERVPDHLGWLAPFPGEELAFSHALQAAHGVSFPAPGTSAHNGATRVLWSGRSQAILSGVAPALAMSAHGAVIVQTEGWSVMELTGQGAAQVLARLCPLDQRPDVFTQGRTARSLLGHMSAHITAISGGFELMVMRSMAGSAAHDLEETMRSLAVRD